MSTPDQNANMAELQAQAEKMRAGAKRDAEMEAFRAENAKKDAEMEALRAEMEALRAEKDAEIAKKDAEIAKKDAEIAKKDAEIKLRSLGMVLENELVFVSRTASTPHFGTKTHKPAKLVQQDLELGFLTEEELENLLKARYTRPTDRCVSINSEADAVAHMYALVNAVLEGMGLQSLVHLAMNRMIAGVECDIVLLFGRQQIPFACIEVKKPGWNDQQTNSIFSSMDDEKVEHAGVVAGQIFDQLCTLELMGYTSLVGMIATGNELMITTRTMETLTEEVSWGLVKAKISSSLTKKEQDSSPEQIGVEFEQEPGAANTSAEVDRSLISSKRVLSSNGKEFLSAITLFVRLACKPLVSGKRTKLSLSNLSCRVLNLKPDRIGGDMRCSFQKKSWSNINLDSCVDYQKDLELYLFYHLGWGDYGDCCLAVNQAGNKCCVVKFFVKSNDIDGTLSRASSELKNWVVVYGECRKLPGCYVGKLPNNDGYLCMPYLKPIRGEDRGKLISSGKVRSALEKFAESGFIHDEVLWRHLGMWGDEIYLLDLGSISELREEKAKEKWVETSLQSLAEKVKTTALATPKGSSTPAPLDESAFEVPVPAAGPRRSKRRKKNP